MYLAGCEEVCGMKAVSTGLVLIIGFLTLAYRQAYMNYSWNQKVTKTVQTPDGFVAASSVGRMVVSEKVSLGIADLHQDDFNFV